MLHEPDGVEEGQLLQVELNTIASSFAGLSQRVAAMHSALMPRWASTRRHAWQAAGKPSQLSMTSVLPPNAAADNLAEALAQAHALYAQDHASILFVVQPHERNHVDQDLLREKLWSMYGVRVICRTLAQIAVEAKLVGKQRRLILPTGDEISVVYFRAGYTPADYPSSRQWDARTILERSYAIKCPCVEHHLVGCKKVQQQLSLPGQLERFVDAEEGAALRKVPCGHVGRCHDPALDRDKVQDRLHRCTCKMRCCVIFQSAPL
uniref:glutathione synthase n=1 Tax=Haptolina ericina TaxID=156174 RepID=A0A6T9P9R9_9EUKA